MTVETAPPTIIDLNNAEPTTQASEKKSKKPIRQVKNIKLQEEYYGLKRSFCLGCRRYCYLGQ